MEGTAAEPPATPSPLWAPLGGQSHLMPHLFSLSPLAGEGRVGATSPRKRGEVKTALNAIALPTRGRGGVCRTTTT